VEALLQRLTELSGLLGRDTPSDRAWRYQVEQAEVLLRLAALSRGAERDNWLRTAVDSYHSAAVLSPAAEAEPRQRLAQLPGRIAAGFPGSPVTAYAALQGVRASYLRKLTEAPDDPALARRSLCEGLVAFAAEYPRSPEAPEAVLEAARAYEDMGRTADARRSYRYLTDHFEGQPVARKAAGALWRLAGPGTPVNLELPPLYPTGERSVAAIQLQSYRSKLVAAYFWSSTAPHAAEDLQTLRELSDRYQDRGFEVVCVNVDADPARARAFLAGRLTAGTHLYLPGGPDGAAERFGLKALPDAMLIAGDGTLARHSLSAAQLEAEVSRRLAGSR
jgi:hypothetical protein